MDCSDYLPDGMAECDGLRAELARVRAERDALREGLVALQREPCCCGACIDVMGHYHDGPCPWVTADALLASPDDAATALLAVRDAYQAAYTYLIGQIAAYQARGYIEWFDDGVSVLDRATALATGPGTSEGSVSAPDARVTLSGAVPGHCFDIDNQTWHRPGERCTRCGFGIEARQ